MKDSFLLLVTGIVCAFLSWAFWAGLGEYAWTVLSTMTVITLMADNIRLRRQLRKQNKG